MLLKKRVLYDTLRYSGGAVVGLKRIKLKDIKVRKNLSYISLGAFNNKKFTIDTLDSFCWIWSKYPERKGEYVYVIEVDNN